MKSTGEPKAWLPWVIKIRFVIIFFIFAIEYTIGQFVPGPVEAHRIKYLGVTVVFWLILNLFFLIYNQLSYDHDLQAHLQIFSDLIIITAVVHNTGDLDSNYFALYLVAIILAAILLPRARSLMVAAVAFVLMGAVFELAYLPSLYPEIAWRHPAMRILATTSQFPVDLAPLQFKIFLSLAGFLAVWYLASFLAENLRETGAELEVRSGQLAGLQAFNDSVIQNMREGLIAADETGTILEANPAASDVLGRTPTDLKGRTIQSVLGSFNGSDATGKGRHEIPYSNPRGQRQILGISISPLPIRERNSVGAVYSLQDLTAEKQREAEYRAKDRMATLGRLSAGIAHEIRNPLASIAGSVKLLRSLANLDEDQSRLMDIVNRESERLNKLVSDFLVYARGQRMELSRVNLRTLVNETLTLLEHHPLFGSRYRIERPADGPDARIEADADKIRQLFWNLCDNAMKAMPQGGVLGVSIEDDGPDQIMVSIWYSGEGFSTSRLERIFEPFQSKFANGAGLGLAIVYQIVEAHRGQVRVISAPGQGTRFVIYLPRHLEAAKVVEAGG